MNRASAYREAGSGHWIKVKYRQHPAFAACGIGSANAGRLVGWCTMLAVTLLD
jgi:hypothetical protein